MFPKRILNYILLGIVSFLLGFFCYKNKNTNATGKYLNKTVAVKKENKYYLIFNSVVVLTREVTLQQYNSFISAYPSMVAQGNVLDEFSPPPLKKYTQHNGNFYESVWDGRRYGSAIEITRDEYEFRVQDRQKQEKEIIQILNPQLCEF